MRLVQIAEEIISLLASDPQASVHVSIEVNAEFPNGVSDHIKPTNGGISLADAKVIVSGGRGVGSKEGFAIIEDLAGLLGAAVGCSRAVTR